MVQKSVLDNGIRIITERVPGAYSATVGFWVECGSRHESSEQSGVSHFLEHMLFKGTVTRSAPSIAKEIDAVGGALNAFTSCEYSCYYAKVAGRHLSMAVDLLADIILNSVFDFDELEKERRVILQEIHMLEDSPEECIHEMFTHSFWQEHPLGRPIAGSVQSVQSLERRDLLAYLEKFYCGSNLIICVAGDVQHEDLVEQISRLAGDLPVGCKSAAGSPPLTHSTIQVAHKDIEQVHFCLGTRAPDQRHGQRFTGNILNTMLGGSMSSRLFQTLREERGMAYSVYSYLTSHSDSGALVVYAGTSASEVQHAINIVLRELSRFQHHEVNPEELQAAKELIKGQFMLSLESTENRMTRLAKNEIYLGHVQTPDEIVEHVQQVTGEDILQLTGKYLRDEHLNLQMVGPITGEGFPSVDLTLG
ncbi:zinc-dependent peptidase, M16 family [Syntrophotalea carbinolica DSM 2380]|uniref:Zinc-dependent peptidase, M16 family n=1 Tax=Syntrophotalea carbinolica (strain DSM 2380 / NBRC 103641 / GraBd1) TaxID=338963 RepID=Q3A4A0_SYNC1|nr:pitrilysin family protein [Syntrophotalea carbinolica]ABA88807.1 zinc-dependent peptidase, M16 family [Syntrophotalea carbinolica DSM 2380]